MVTRVPTAPRAGLNELITGRNGVALWFKLTTSTEFKVEGSTFDFANTLELPKRNTIHSSARKKLKRLRVIGLFIAKNQALFLTINKIRAV